MGVTIFGITFGLAAAVSVGVFSGSFLTALMAYVTLGTISVFVAAVAVYLRPEPKGAGEQSRPPFPAE